MYKSNLGFFLLRGCSAKHIIKIDGKVGLFKGLGPRLCAGAIGTVVHSRVVQVSTSGAQLSLQLLPQVIPDPPGAAVHR